MDKNEFRKLLFKVAFCTMACDGHIDDREIQEMKIMDKHTSFFDKIDLSSELEDLLNELESKGVVLITELFQELQNADYNPVQEFIILEVALRIINADGKHDENEVKFIHFLRAHLRVHDELIIERFGELDILHTSPYLRKINFQKDYSGLISDLIMPEDSELRKIDLKLD